jgi:NAD-dependent deacetylase
VRQGAHRKVAAQLCGNARRLAFDDVVFMLLDIAVVTREFDARLIAGLRRARHVAVLTGAGISAESGIPTFRDAQSGLWSRFRPEELATAAAFRRNPQLVWDWYAWRRGLVACAEPNAGHRSLARLEPLVPSLALITQNVDGLHQRAGSTAVIELHGNIHRNKCFAEDVLITGGYDERERPPRCPQCGAHLRPDVVWFGETLPPRAVADAENAVRSADVMFSIGTSAAVFPAAQLPLIALKSGAMVVEINKDRTPLTGVVTLSLLGLATDILPRLLDTTWPA